MHDPAVPASRLITICLWSVTGVTFLVSLAVAAAGYIEQANLIAHGACILGSVSTVSHVRCIALKSVRTLRAALNAEREPVVDRLHSIV